jgi:orotidine-5'-phosphate decarboxylase
MSSAPSSTSSSANSPIIIALDVASATEAHEIVRNLGDSARFYKVGLELYAAAGMELVRALKSEGCRVFLDLKLYDIGETVKRATAQIAQVGVDFLTVHAITSVMQGAIAGKAALGKDGPPLNLLAVTVLTSFDESDLRQDGYSCSVAELVQLRVRNAVAVGVDGIVCSAMEVEAVRQITGPAAKLVTPGVRSAGAAVGDQKRVATPAEAIAAGADYLVIGRQVTRAADPRAEVRKILDEIHAGA